MGRKAGKVVSLKDWIGGMGKRRTGGIKRKLPCPNKTQLVPSETRNKNQGKNLNPGLDKAGLIVEWALPTLLILNDYDTLKSPPYEGGDLAGVCR